MTELDPENRLNYKGDLAEFVNDAAEYYEIGRPTAVSHLAEGYEDCNLRLTTESGNFVLKIFADNQLGDYSKTRRGKDVADRLVDIILAIQANGANVPQLLDGKDSHLFRNSELVALGYKWIEGKTYFDLDRAPTDEELEAIIRQTALINTTDSQPVYYHDIWAVTNIHALAKKVGPKLSDSDKQVIDKVLERFDRLNFDSLPKCLVHGDMTKGNVLLQKNAEPFIIDFSVTNWTTRIIELSLIISNLMFDEADDESLTDKAHRVAAIYQKYNPLTTEEVAALPDLCLAGSAMELLGGRWRQEFMDDDSEETKYWLELGRKTLQKELEQD